MMKKEYKAHCKVCKCDWGLIVNYRDMVYLPLLKAKGIKNPHSKPMLTLQVLALNFIRTDHFDVSCISWRSRNI